MVDPPEACPVCGGRNLDPETGGMYDAETYTCGVEKCRVQQAAQVAEAARLEAEDERKADDAEAAWLAELEKMSP